MPEPTINDVLVILARLEQKMEAVNTTLTKLEQTSDQHWKRLNQHEVDIELLKQRQGPRVHWTSFVAIVVGALGFIAAFVTWVVK
jgi:hypothetical protein